MLIPILSFIITSFSQKCLIDNEGIIISNLNNFKNSLVFEFKDSGKNLRIYTEGQEPIEIEDYQHNKIISYDKSGCCILPTTYILGKSQEYEMLLSDESARRAIYKE